MSSNHEVLGSTGSSEIVALARMARIAIEEESLSLVAEMLDAVSSAADNLLSPPDADVSGIVEPFDPAWPAPSRGVS